MLCDKMAILDAQKLYIRCLEHRDERVTNSAFAGESARALQHLVGTVHAKSRTSKGRNST